MNEICIEYRAMFNYVITVPHRLFQGTLGISVFKILCANVNSFFVADRIILSMLPDILRELFSPIIDGHWSSGRYRLNHILFTLMAVGIAVINSGFSNIINAVVCFFASCTYNPESLSFQIVTYIYIL